MGREIQKRKNRSGDQKIRQKPKSKKRLLQHPVIAANWDKSQTLTQNYKRLGLAAKLNKHTGGTERKAGDVGDLQAGEPGRTKKGNGLSIGGASGLEVAEARIERDPETGKILRVVEPEASARTNPLNDPLNDLDDEEMDEVSWATLANQHGNVDEGAYTHAQEGEASEVVRELEARASRPAAKYVRKQTDNEKAFIEELVAKYGDNYGKMSRDMKINYMQRSEGDIKKRVKKWREAGGQVGGE